MSEFEKMRAGEIYNPRDLKLIYMYDKTARRLHRYNKRCFHVYNMRSRLMKKIINTSGNFWIHPPFQCDYGCNIYLGKDVMINYGCVFLDVCEIKIGDNTLIGPHTQIYTACHSIDPQLRSPYGLDRRPRRRFGNLPLLRLAKRVQLYAPGGLSVVQQCERVWRRVVRVHVQRFVVHDREHRLSARLPRKSRQSDERQRV